MNGGIIVGDHLQRGAMIDTYRVARDTYMVARDQAKTTAVGGRRERRVRS